MQYHINGDLWLGIRTSDFVVPLHVVPLSVSPPAPIISKTDQPPPAPVGDHDVNAWDGDTKDFVQKDHEPSAFELNFGPNRRSNAVL